MTLGRCHNIEDLRRQARRRLPRGLFEFIDRATEDDVALRLNRAGLERIRLAPRMLVDVAARTTEVELFGRRLAMPVVVSPAGPAGFFWHKGELALARAAARAGVPFTLSTYSTTEMSEIIEAGAIPWFQLYLWQDRTLSFALLDKARTMGFEALVVTVDTPVLGQREYLHHNGFLPPFHASPKALFDMLLHPRWLAGVPLRYALVTGWPRIVNMPESAGGSQADADIERRTTLSQTTTWEELARVRDRWPGTMMVKGILREDDARRAAELGCDAVVVSNHGGRNLDAAVSPIDVLPAIVAAVGSRMTVLMDSGIRRGSDIVKALALGASAVLVGRAPLYGVSVAGEDGALHALALLQSELTRTMALTGCSRIADITPDLVFQPA
ncbi:MAG: alpha-hydroxy acid oxidase [Geminicoccaceae bacterium]